METPWPELVDEVGRTGRRLRREELEAMRVGGEKAAESGVELGALVDAHLAATGEVWAGRRLEAASLNALRASVSALAAGHGRAHRRLLRSEEAGRREFLADLLSTRSDLGRLAEHADRFGLNLARAHVVAVAEGDGYDLADPQVGGIERRLLARFAEQDVLLAVKHGSLVCIAPDGPRTQETVEAFARLTERPRVAVGRPHGGPVGVMRSYEEARSALSQAIGLGLPGPLLRAADLVVLPVLMRDRQALTELVLGVLGPLRDARGGAQPLLETLGAYAQCRYVATEAARRLGLSVRALSYRLERITQLTGFDPDDALQRYTLETAALGARLLDWPTQPLS